MRSLRQWGGRVPALLVVEREEVTREQITNEVWVVGGEIRVVGSGEAGGGGGGEKLGERDQGFWER